MKKVNISLITVLFAGILALSTPAQATVVLFDTNMGQIEVNLLDEHTPETVDNFIRYIEADAYQNTIIHRSKPNFVIQGGGYQYNFDTNEVESASTFESVVNEPIFSNVRGTIAMAKLGSNVNSATNQWFFNTQNNSGNLDNQNGGFTVFGVVTLGMDIVDQINELPRYEIQGLPAFTDTPLQDQPTGDGITDEHFVIVEAITVTDVNSDTYTDIPDNSVYFSKSTISAGEDRVIKSDNKVSLNGSTTLDFVDFSYHWKIISKPENSNPDFFDDNTLSPTFSADTTGEYVLEFKVSHNQLESFPDTLKITVQNDDPTLPPVDDNSSGGGSLFWLLSFLGFGLLRRAAK